MSGPRTKRQFAGASSDPAQRQITTFFSKADCSTSASNAVASSTTTPLNGPAIPAHVQASLLNVGMRVRKSVNEGYKTDPSAGSAFALWSDPASDATPVTSTLNAPFYSAPARELVPFCGINRVGGLSVQPLTTIHDDSPPFFTAAISSQESNSSVTSATAAMETSAAANRKRSYVEEEEGNDDTNISAHHGNPWREWLDGEISPHSVAPAGWGNARTMAIPKTRSRKSITATGPPSSLAGLGQENMVLDDFDEAPFLSFGAGNGEAGDMDVE